MEKEGEMSNSVNKVMLIGNIGRDAEVKFTPSGQSRTTFSLALSKRWKGQDGEWKERTEWANIVAWGKEKLSEYLSKGKQVYVEGELSTRNYENNDGKKVYVTEVVANTIQLLGNRGQDDSQPRQSASRPRTTTPGAQTPAADPPFSEYEDDIPF